MTGDEGYSLPTEPVLTGPKRQHVVPMCYQLGFAEERKTPSGKKCPMVAVYDRTKKATDYRQPINTAVIGQYYTLKDELGRKRFELEAFLSIIEKKGILALKRLAVREQVSAQERADAAIFASIAGFRTPDMAESISHFTSGMARDILNDSVDDHAEATRVLREIRPGMSDEELNKKLRMLVDATKADKYIITVNPEWAIGRSLQAGLEIAPMLGGRKWMVLHRPTNKRSFITSDAPLIITQSEMTRNNGWEGVGYGCIDSVVLFPISQSCVLIMYGEAHGEEATQHRDATSVEIRQINLTIANRCKQYLIGRDTDTLKDIAARLRLGEREWSPRIKRS